jgi:hypothetical protein
MGLCAVIFGVMAMSASSAQALSLDWLVLNAAGTVATLIEGSPVNLLVKLVGEKDSADLTLLAKTLGIKVIFTCTNFEISSTNPIHLAAAGKLTEGGKIKFTGCEAYKEGTLTGALGCHVKTSGAAEGTIETTEGKGELVLHELAGGGKEVLTKLEPKTAGGAFATILTSGCVLPESNKVSGVLYLKDCLGKATTHEVKHLVEQGPLTSLVYGSHSVEHLETSLDGSGWIKLGASTIDHTGLKWAAMDTP